MLRFSVFLLTGCFLTVGCDITIRPGSGAREASAQEAFPPTSFHMEVPKELRAWFRNPDGSCVQCSIGLVGLWNNVPAATTLLWDTAYGPKVRGGSWPGRVAEYARRRKIPIYNVTGRETWDWMDWACRTGRFAAIGAGGSHFQALYGWDPPSDTYYVNNNNSTHRIDTYSDAGFHRLHRASGEWCVVLDTTPCPPVPIYSKWWGEASRDAQARPRSWRLSPEVEALLPAFTP
jgi:hypothetical protein